MMLPLPIYLCWQWKRSEFRVLIKDCFLLWRNTVDAKQCLYNCDWPSIGLLHFVLSVPAQKMQPIQEDYKRLHLKKSKREKHVRLSMDNLALIKFAEKFFSNKFCFSQDKIKPSTTLLSWKRFTLKYSSCTEEVIKGLKQFLFNKENISYCEKELWQIIKCKY